MSGDERFSFIESALTKANLLAFSVVSRASPVCAPCLLPIAIVRGAAPPA